MCDYPSPDYPCVVKDYTGSGNKTIDISFLPDGDYLVDLSELALGVTDSLTFIKAPMMYKCENNNCVRDDINGTYTEPTCNNKCTEPVKHYKCIEGNCVENSQGTYTSPNCDNKCSLPQKNYSCINGVCTEDPSGKYTEPTCNNECKTEEKKDNTLIYIAAGAGLLYLATRKKKLQQP